METLILRHRNGRMSGFLFIPISQHHVGASRLEPRFGREIARLCFFTALSD